MADVHAGVGPLVGVQLFKLYVNGAATALVATLAPGGTDGSDSTNAVTVAAGDVLEIRGETGAGATGALDVSATCVLMGS